MKVDVLGLGMLSAIRRSFELVEGFDGRKLTMASIPAEDPNVYRDDLSCRHDRRVSDRVARANGDAAAAQAEGILRPGYRSGDHQAGSDPRRHGSSLSAAPQRRGSGDVSEQGSRGGAEAHARRADISGAGHAACHRRSGFHPGRGRSAAPSNGRVAPHAAGSSLSRSGWFAACPSADTARNSRKRIFNQIKGFGEYGFPESHAASFALLVYVSAWLKYHEPAAFFCALLNSQPMGFYAPQQLVRSRARAWRRSATRRRQSQRLGFDARAAAHGRCEPFDSVCELVKGFSASGAVRVAEARASGLRFAHVQDLAERARTRREGLGRARYRRSARKRSRAIVIARAGKWRAWRSRRPLLDRVRLQKALPMLRRPTEGEDIAADYRHFGVSLGRHPLALLRDRFDALWTSKTARGVAGSRRRQNGTYGGARHHSAAARRAPPA